MTKFFIENGVNYKSIFKGIDIDYTLEYIEMGKYLIERDPTFKDNDLFIFFAKVGHLDIVRTLINRGCDIHFRNDYALRWASYYGRFEVIKYLVEKGAHVHAMDDWCFKYKSPYPHINEFLATI